MRAKVVGTALLVCFLANVSAGRDSGIPGSGRGETLSTVGMPRSLRDSQGYRWDISSLGSIGDGTNDAYDGAMILTVNGWRFSGGRARQTADGFEVVLGPAQAPNGLQVIRRVRVNQAAAYCRWVDIIYNPTSRRVNVSIQLHLDMGAATRFLQTATGSSAVGAKDYAFVTSDRPMGAGRGRPSMFHVVASPRSKLIPNCTVPMGNDDYYFRVSNLAVPARRAVALVWVQAQRWNTPDAISLLRSFNYRQLMRSVPRDIMPHVVNFRRSAGFFDLAGLAVEQDTTFDLVYQSEEDFIAGSIANKAFTIKTIGFGQIKLPKSQLAAFVRTSSWLRPHRIALKDGQILSGRLTEEKLRFLPAASDKEISFSPRDVLQIGFRAEEPAEPTGEPGETPEAFEEPEAKPVRLSQPMLIFGSGDRILARPQGESLRAATVYGDAVIKFSQLAEVTFREDQASTPRFHLRDGSVLSGLLRDTVIPVTSEIAGEIQVRSHQLDRIIFGTRADVGESSEPVVILRNGDELVARFATERLNVATSLGRMSIATAEIASLERPGSNPERVRLTMAASGAFLGEIEESEVAVVLACGLRITVPVSSIARYRNPQPRIPRSVIKSVQARIRILGEGDWKKREAAKQEIVKLGPSVRPVLERILTETDDQEVRVHLEEIIRRLREQELQQQGQP